MKSEKKNEMSEIPYFTNVKNNELDPYFLDYLDRLRSFLAEKTLEPVGSILEMVINSDISHIEMSLFLDYNDNNLNRALLYLLVRDQSIKADNVNSSYFSNFLDDDNHIKSLFSESSQIYFDCDEVETLLNENGIAAIAYSLPVKNDKLRTELARMVYEDAIDYEPEQTRAFFFNEDLTPYLCSSVRALSIVNGKAFAGKCYGESDIPVEVVSMAHCDFFFLDKIDQKKIIDNGFSVMDQFMSQFYKNGERGVVEALAVQWPSEFIRSRIVGENFRHEDIDSARGVIEILLERLMSNKSEIKKATDAILKSALIPFKAQFNAIFDDDIPPIGAIISHTENLIETGDGNTARLWSGFSFGPAASSFGLAQSTVKMLSRYDEYKDDIVDYCASTSFMTHHAIASLIKSHSLDPLGIENKIVNKWLENKAEKPIPSFYHLDQIYQRVKDCNNTQIVDNYNNALLSVFLKGSGVGEDDVLVKFIFESDHHKKIFIEYSKIYNMEMSRELILSGDFSYSDFKPYWKDMGNKSKRFFLSSEMSL